MATRRPLVLVSGLTSELPDGDSVVGISAGNVTAGSGLDGGGDVSTDIRLDVRLAPNPSGIIYVGTGDTSTIGLDGVAQASGNAGISLANTALASGNAALTVSSTALSSGNAALILGNTALASGNAALSQAEVAQASGNAALSNAAVALASGNAGLSLANQALASGNAALTKLYRNYYSTTIPVNAAAGDSITVLASGVFVLLPASPSTGDEIVVGTGSGIADTVISRNGNLIMQRSENLTVDRDDTNVTIRYVNASLGWRIY